MVCSHLLAYLTPKESLWLSSSPNNITIYSKKVSPMVGVLVVVVEVLEVTMVVEGPVACKWRW